MRLKQSADQAGHTGPALYVAVPVGRRRLTMLLQVAVLVVMVALLTALVVSALSKDDDPVRVPGPGGGAGAPQLALAGGAQGQMPGQAPIVVWARAIRPPLLGIRADIQALTAAAGAQDIAGLATACGSLGQDVTTAQAVGTAPDAVLDRAATTALTYYGQAADACQRGMAAMDSTELATASAAIQAAEPYVDQVSQRLAEL